MSSFRKSKQFASALYHTFTLRMKRIQVPSMNVETARNDLPISHDTFLRK